MLAFQLISNEVFPLKKTDTCAAALIFMNDWQINHLPVVDNGKVIGFVSEKTLPDDEKKKINDQINTSECFVNEHMHLFDVLKKLHTFLLTSIAVVDDENVFRGIILTRELATIIYNNSSLKQDGGIVVLEIKSHNYSLAEIARISEVNNAKIIYVHVEQVENNNQLVHVSLKYNVSDLKSIIATFERFNYTIVYATQTEDESHNFKSRYNWLLKYLNT